MSKIMGSDLVGKLREKIQDMPEGHAKVEIDGVIIEGDIHYSNGRNRMAANAENVTKVRHGEESA